MHVRKNNRMLPDIRKRRSLNELMESLKNKIAFVTGASRGIGRAIALALADEGMRVAVGYLHAKEKAAAVCRAIEAKGVKALALQGDVSDAGTVNSCIARIEETFGSVDVLVNNAGVAVAREIQQTSEKDFDEIIRQNLKSSFLVTQAVLSAMLKNGWGRIVFISSTAAQTGGGIGLHYAASKAGQIGMMHFYATRLAKDGITVNAIAPALIETDMLGDLKSADAARLPVGRFGSPDEIAQAVILLVNNGYITNQTINVNGGIHPSG
jgi:3-oxoacyl-[acyl-carrier protein] reductase